MPMTAGLGALQFQFVGTWLQSFQTSNVLGGPTYDCAGLFGPTCSSSNTGATSSGPLPKWRHRLRTTWTTPWDVDFSANWRYVSGVTLDSNTKQAVPHERQVRRGRRDDQRLLLVPRSRGGLERAHGRRSACRREQRVRQAAADADDGCVAGVTGNDNTFPGIYDSLGRTFFIGATIKY